MDPYQADGAVGAAEGAPGQAMPSPLPPPGRSRGSPPWLDLAGGFASPKSTHLQAAADQAAEEALQLALDGMQQADAGDDGQGLGPLGTSPPPPAAPGAAAAEAAAAAAVALAANGDAPADGMQVDGGVERAAAAPAASLLPAAPPSAAAMTAAPQAPEPLHFISYKSEQYTRPATVDGQPAVQLRRWFLEDSVGRWHLAVDTLSWGGSAGTTYGAVQPFSVVRPMACHREAEVRQYLEKYIPPHRREQPAPGGPPLGPALQGQQAQQAAGAALAQYATGLQPAGAKRRPGRPRIHPPKEPKRPRPPQAGAPGAPGAALGAPAAVAASTPGAAGLPGGPADAAVLAAEAAAAAVGPLALAGTPGGEPGGGEGAAGGSGKQLRAKIGTLAERTYIQDEEKRKQVYQLRLEAALAELSLLKAQCGVDYSLTLVSAEREVQVVTSATANVQAVKVVRAKRLVGKPGEEAEPAGADCSAAAAAVASAAIQEQKQEQKQKKAQEAAAAKAAAEAAALPVTLPGMLPPFALPATLALPPLPLPQPLPGVAGVVSAQQQQQQQQQAVTPTQVGSGSSKAAAGKHKSRLGRAAVAAAADVVAAAETGSTGGKKRRGRPPKHAREEDAETPPAAKRAKQAAGGMAGLLKLARVQASPPAGTDPLVKQLLPLIEDNAEAYMQGLWRRQPYDGVNLEHIDTFVLAEDCGEELDAAALPGKLLSSLAPPPAASPDGGAAATAGGAPGEAAAAADSGAGGAAAEAAAAFDAAAAAAVVAAASAQSGSPGAGGSDAAAAPNGRAAEAGDMMLLAELPPGLAGGEVEVRQTWGLDSYTRRNIWTALGRCPELGSHNTVQLDEARARFIERHLLPALNRREQDGWDILPALQQLVAGATGPDAAAMRAAAALLVWAVEGIEAWHNKGQRRDAEDREYFRVWPKGEGVVLLRAEGLPAGAFLGQYLGELYAAWRWLERDNTSAGRFGRRPAGMRLGTSAEFYNAVVERPARDAGGYDVLFVNASRDAFPRHGFVHLLPCAMPFAVSCAGSCPCSLCAHMQRQLLCPPLLHALPPTALRPCLQAAHKGNFTSRLSHSCNPNCRVVPMVAGGHITLGVWTTQPVAAGEELTLDWACETESEREHKVSVCLCGSPACRGSLLHLVNRDSGPLHQYAQAHHSFLERTQLLLRVRADSQLTAANSERLARHGFGDWLLTDGAPGSGGAGVPPWLRRWAALVLEYIEEEARQLPKLLAQGTNRRVPGPKPGAPGAATENGAGGDSGDEEGEEGEEEDELEAKVAAEVTDHRRARVQALAFALDKAKLVLRHQSEEEARAAPLRLLLEEEAVDFLWTGEDSVARRAVACLAAFTQQAHVDNLVQGRKPRNAAKPAWLRNTVDAETYESLEPSAPRPPRCSALAERKRAAAAMLGALSAAPSSSSMQGRVARSESHGAVDRPRQGSKEPSAAPEGEQAAAAGAEGRAGEAPADEAAAAAGQAEGASRGGDAAEDQQQHQQPEEQQQQQVQQQQPEEQMLAADGNAQGPGGQPPAVQPPTADQQQQQQNQGQEDQQAAGTATPDGTGAPALAPAAVGASSGDEAAAAEQDEGKEGAAEGGGEEEPSEPETLAEQLEAVVDSFEVSSLADAQQGLRRMAALLRAAGVGHAALHDLLLLYASVQSWVGLAECAAFNPALANGEEGERYRPQYLWALLSFWYRAGSSNDPTAWLTNERRGCLNLPEIECSYLPVFSTGGYVKKGHRQALLQHLTGSARAAWPTGSPFTFKNPHRVYGSPQLDAVLSGSTAQLEALVAELDEAF
ncbi:hypothetical protein ABPG75_013565 [Micractinium tetrahymenae]